MATSREPFAPQTGRTVAFAATTTSTPYSFAGLGAISQVRIANPGTVSCRVEFGGSNAVAVVKPIAGGATAGSMLIPPGVVEIFSLPSTSTWIALATDTGTTTIEFTPGIGF